MSLLDYFHVLSVGAWVTVKLALYSTVLGGILSFMFGIGRISHRRYVRWISLSLIEIFRGTSLLVQLFWFFFGLPVLGNVIGIDLRMPPVVAGTLALSLNIGAYGAEVVRGALQAVSPEQFEAATALDFTRHQTLWRISLPQAIPEMMPTFNNLAIQNLKDTALVSMVGLADMTFQATRLRNYTQDSIPIYTMLLFMYFGMALILAALMHLLEKYVSRWREGRG